MRVIFKYALDAVGENEITMPFGARIISVGHDGNDELCVWAIVDDSLEPAPRGLFVAPTGVSISPDETDGSFLGSSVSLDGYVWHVFDHGWKIS